MRRLLRAGLLLPIGGCVVAATTWLPAGLADLEYFRATDFRVVGTVLLGEEEVLAAAAIPPHASVLDAVDAWELRLLRHPLIRRARISRDFPETLVITVEERAPVALTANEILEPVDRDGLVLPLDPGRRRMDLPLLRPSDAAPRLSTAQLRVLALEIERLTAEDPSFMAGVSEIAMDPRGDLTAVVDDDVRIRFRPPLARQRLREGLAVLEDAERRRTDRRAAAIDLRYADQVVVTYEPYGAPRTAGRGR